MYTGKGKNEKERKEKRREEKGGVTMNLSLKRMFTDQGSF